MSGANALPVQDWPDDFQVTYLEELGTAIFADNTQTILPFKVDRDIVIDKIFVWVDTVEATVASVAATIYRAVGPLGETGADADVAAVLTAARDVAEINFGTGGDVTVAQKLYEMDLGTDATTGVPDENEIRYNYEDTSDNAGLQDLLVMDVQNTGDANAAELDGVHIGIRWRSRYA